MAAGQVGPFDSPHLYVQWSGKLPGNEEWSCGLRMAPVGQGNVSQAASIMPGIVTAIKAFHSRATSMIAGPATLNSVKVNAIGVDGKYVLPTTNETIFADIGGGAAGYAPYPNQVALAVSLTTGFSRGPAHRGRFFLPLPACGLGVDGLISLGDRTSIQTSTTGLLTALNAVNAGFSVAVFSRKDLAPAHRIVTGVEVGRVLDTQRRRRRSLLEQY